MTFDQFWSIYPRKMAHKDALKAWGQITPEQQAQALKAIPFHVEYWAACETAREYIPYPATWLRGHRFKDELEMPKPKADSGWAKSEAGIIAEGKRRGLEPKRGEDLWNFRARVEAA